MTVLPSFPPLISGHRVGRDDDPFAIAAAKAARGEAEAGDLYWSGIENRLAAAIVLEPDVAAEAAQVIHLAVMVALGDCIGALSPPEVGIFYRWPDGIIANGASLGTASLALAPADRLQVPDWLVAGVDIRIRPARREPDPGVYRDRTTLWDEGATDLERTPLLESFARHLKAWIHTFETDGAAPVIAAWLARAEGRGATVSVDYRGARRAGAFLGLDEVGDMIFKTETGTELLSLKEALT